MATISNGISDSPSNLKRKVNIDFFNDDTNLTDMDLCHNYQADEQNNEHQSQDTFNYSSPKPKKIKKISSNDNKSLNKKSVKKYRKYIDKENSTNNGKSHSSESEENNEENGESQVELKVWHYLLHHLDDDEKLLALKLLVGMNKMKKKLIDNMSNKDYVDKKIVDELKLVKKKLQENQQEYEKAREILIREKNELEENIIQERKSRFEMAEILANEVAKNENLMKKMYYSKENSIQNENTQKFNVNNYVGNEQMPFTSTFTNDINDDKKKSEGRPIGRKKKTINRTVNDVTNKEMPATTIKSEIHEDNKADLRNIIRNREYGENREQNTNRMLQVPNNSSYPISAHYLRDRRIKRSKLAMIIRGPGVARRTFAEIRECIECKTGIVLHTSGVRRIRDYWRVKCISTATKEELFNRRMMLKGTGIFLVEDTSEEYMV